MKQRLLSALLYGASIVSGRRQPRCLLAVCRAVVALVLIARIHSQEVNRDMALTENRNMKRIIQVQYVIELLFHRIGRTVPAGRLEFQSAVFHQHRHLSCTCRRTLDDRFDP